jgi:thiosulfate dehydrogenase (quinone) large subunit
MGSDRRAAARPVRPGDGPARRPAIHSGPAAQVSGGPDVLESWRSQTWPVRVLRAFLGVTFLYAGVQKFADPNFLHSGTPDYIGSQLLVFQRGSPIHALLAVSGHFPVLTGIGIAMLEIAIGLGTLLGTAPIIFAALGMAVNIILFLSASWHARPYFLGSDSVYAVAWLAVLTGLVTAKRPRFRPPTRGTRHQREVLRAAGGIGRREFVRAAVIGVGTLLLGAGATAVAGQPAPTRASLRRKLPGRPGQGGSASGSVSGTPITKLDGVPIGGAFPFNDPASGDPAVLLRLSSDTVEAFSRVCTHAGCSVQWDQANRLLVCPCHGAEFDPAHGAEPVAGPAYSPLPRIPVAIDAGTGEVVATA